MKSITRNTAFFFLLAAAIVGLVGCSDTVTSQKGPSDGSPANGSNNTQTKVDEAKKQNPNYRPIEKAIDEAEIKAVDGTTFRVADKRGKIILLNLWATWCGPCRAEMPVLVRMQENYRGRDFEVIGLNTDDETPEEINEFAGKMKLNYTLAWSDTALYTALLRISKFGGIPQSFIIDRDGNLRGVFRGAGPADIKKMEELVELILNE